MKNLFLPALLLVAACASKPQLYPNAKYKRVGKEAARQDVEKCMAEAEEHVESGKGKQVAKGAGAGAAIGAAMGAVSGLFTGDVGGSIARSGAVGAAGGATVGGLSPDQIKRNYVNQCLGEKGYQVLGWD